MPPWPAAVVIAALCVHRLPAVAPAGASVVMMAIGAGLLVAGRAEGRVALRFLALLIMAGGWTMLRADLALGERLVPAQEGVDFTVHGHVTGMPQAFERGDRFTFRIDRCVGPSAPDDAAGGGGGGGGGGGVEVLPACPAGREIRLAWYRNFGAPPVERPRRPASGNPQPGERWQLTVRLKRPHALLNPDAFDAELRSLEEGIAGSGYVRAPRDRRWPNKRLEGRNWRPGPVIESIRTILRDAIVDALAGHRADASGVVAALSIGDQAAIPGSWWNTFNRTGVSHLMSISGLHITMLAGMAGGLARRLLRHPRIGRPALLGRWPADRIKWAITISVAFVYSALAGWGIPAQRTCWMLAVAGLAMLGGRSQSIGRVLTLSAAVVTVIDPWAPMSAGFWLSFAAVAAIIWYGTRPAVARRRPLARIDRARAHLSGLLVDALRTQWAATLSLLPLGALFFSSFSVVGPLANAFAIPLVSIIITPLALLGTALLVLPMAGQAVLGAVCTVSGWLLDALVPLSAPSFAILVLPTPGWPATIAAALAIVVLLAPFRVPARPAALLALLPLFIQADPLPAPGSLVVTALDVGQGAAILVETPAGRLLFDAGPRYGGDSEAGARVLVPYLRTRGIEHLDALVVSHADEDHAGGMASVLSGVRVGWVASSLPDEHPALAAVAAHRRCWRGQRWNWGEVAFEFLHPGPERTGSVKSKTNANSCVLRVASPAGTVLLTGDIESAQERFLVEKLGPRSLRADLLVSPHHGSNGSSSMPFLAAVAPTIALVQAGYRNRFRHPGDKALVRYRLNGIRVLRSDRDGAVSVVLRANRAPQVSRLRIDERRYWRIQVETADQ